MANESRKAFEQSERNRRTALMMQFGVISEVNHDDYTAKIAIDDEFETPFLKVPASVGENYVQWSPLRVGTAVLLAVPHGELKLARIVTLLWSAEIQPPANTAALDIIQFNDGTVISYDSENQRLNVNAAKDIAITSGANVAINAKQLTLQADAINIKGPVEQTGGDMTSDGISAQKHLHEYGAPPKNTDVPK